MFYSETKKKMKLHENLLKNLVKFLKIPQIVKIMQNLHEIVDTYEYFFVKTPNAKLQSVSYFFISRGMFCPLWN